jgi:hypothetical protein
MATKKKAIPKKTVSTVKKAVKTTKKALPKPAPLPVEDHPEDDFSTTSDKFAFRHSPVEEEPQPSVVIEEDVEENLVEEEVFDSPAENETPSSEVHHVVATSNFETVKSPHSSENFTNYAISSQLAQSIAEKLGIHYKQIDIILTGGGDEIEISFGRIYLSGEDVARLSISEE